MQGGLWKARAGYLKTSFNAATLCQTGHADMHIRAWKYHGGMRVALAIKLRYLPLLWQLSAAEQAQKRLQGASFSVQSVTRSCRLEQFFLSGLRRNATDQRRLVSFVGNLFCQRQSYIVKCIIPSMPCHVTFCWILYAAVRLTGYRISICPAYAG